VTVSVLILVTVFFIGCGVSWSFSLQAANSSAILSAVSVVFTGVPAILFLPKHAFVAGFI
jgi:hypothetical protein